MYLFRFIHNRRKTEGSTAIELRVQRSRRDRHWVSTKVIVDPAQWDAEKQVVVKHPQRVMYNARLRQIMLDVENLQTEAIRSGREMMFDEVRALLRGRKIVHFAASFDIFMEQALNNLKGIELSTLKDYRQTLVVLRKFRPHVYFHEIGSATAVSFIDWMQKKPYRANTIAKVNANIRLFIRKAVRQKLARAEQLDGWCEVPTPFVKGSRVPLSMAEIEKIEALHYDKKNIVQARDMFLFSCYTGLRFVDVTRLHSDMITVAGKKANLTMTTQKTRKKGVSVNLPLHYLFGGKPLRILRRYLSSGPVFKKMDNYTVNCHLKTIASDAGIPHRLTFHYSRHSFCSNLAMKLKNPYLLMNYAGITSLETAMIYINVAQQMTGEELKGIKW